MYRIKKYFLFLFIAYATCSIFQTTPMESNQKAIQCNVCLYIFVDKKRFNDHQRFFQCKLCKEDNIYPCQNTYKDHWEYKHSGTPLQNGKKLSGVGKCLFCNNSYRYSCLLYRGHLKTISCLCKKIIYCNASYENHWKIDPQHVGKKLSYQCAACSQQFAALAVYGKHVRNLSCMASQKEPPKKNLIIIRKQLAPMKKESLLLQHHKTLTIQH
jgi:hypothetical protein